MRYAGWFNLPLQASANWTGRLLILRDITPERQLDRLRNDLTATLVHDLRSPIAVLRGALQVFEMDSLTTLTADQQEMHATMRSAIDSLANMITAILDVNRLESGQFPLQIQDVPLAELALELRRSHKPVALARKLTLELDIPGDLPCLRADPNLLQRVLQNLLNNALKFTPPGGCVRLSVTAQAEAVHISVSDTGPGIPSDLRTRLFQKYATGRTAGHGHGLGLTFCRLAVEAHGGQIRVESAPGQGSTFHFTLPLK